MLTGPAPLELNAINSEHLVPQLTDEYNAAVLILLAVIGGFVALMEQSGGGYACQTPRQRAGSKPNPDLRVERWHRDFSQTLHTTIVGPAFRALFDRIGLSRQSWPTSLMPLPLGGYPHSFYWVGVYIEFINNKLSISIYRKAIMRFSCTPPINSMLGSRSRRFR